MINAELKISFGSEQIPVKLEFRDKKDLSITVNPDRSVLARAPKGSDIDSVLQRIQRKALWIAKQREYFGEIVPVGERKRYISGETFLYSGRQYRLKVHSDDLERVRLLGRHLHVFCSSVSDTARVKTLLEKWYLEHAKLLFSARLERCRKASTALKNVEPKLIVRRMEKRWGSYNRPNRILLNVELAKTPLACMDYVITHELCHLLIANHSVKFFNMLRRCMPDWEKNKAKLEKFAV